MLYFYMQFLSIYLVDSHKISVAFYSLRFLRRQLSFDGEFSHQAYLLMCTDYWDCSWTIHPELFWRLLVLCPFLSDPTWGLLMLEWIPFLLQFLQLGNNAAKSHKISVWASFTYYIDIMGLSRHKNWEETFFQKSKAWTNQGIFTFDQLIVN